MRDLRDAVLSRPEDWVADALIAEVDLDPLLAVCDDAVVGTIVVDLSPTPPGPKETLSVPMVMVT